MNDVPLPALEGANPLGFLAALGVLDAVSAASPGATLRWTEDLVPHAIVGGVAGIDELLDLLQADQARLSDSPLLRFPEDGTPLSDAKPGGEQLREWFEFIAENGQTADMDQLCAIVAEDAHDNNGRGKPTHLHFTAGQQQFLNMVRQLALKVDRERLREAVEGPWRYDSPLPSLSWDSRGDRVYAVRATNPSKDKRLGVPGADLLAFRGLVFYPVMRTGGGGLRTTACDRDWKSSAFRWPLWAVPATRGVVRSLVAERRLVGQGARVSSGDLAARGISSLRESKIRRNETGGYGSFAAAETLVSSAGGR